MLEDMLHAMKKKNFHPSKKVYSWFVGEAGRDTGGITREMWTLLGKDIANICDGKDNCKIPRHDADKLQVPLLYVCMYVCAFSWAL